MTIRGFAGLPDGSEWIVDEVAVAGADERAAGRDDALEDAGAELARRMMAAGAGDLLRAAEEMAIR